MQQKVNLVELLVNGELITLEDVLVIETEDGIYVEIMIYNNAIKIDRIDVTFF